MRALPLALVWVALAAGSASAEPDAPTEPPPDAAIAPEEMRCEELARRFEALLAQYAQAPPDEVALVEAQEIGVVADELRAEGDLPSAEALFEEAIALLEGAEPAS